MREEILRIEHVTLQRNGSNVLENFSMNMWKGEILGIIKIDEVGTDALLDILQYNHRLHYGYVYMHERPVNSWNAPGKGMNRISIIRSCSALADKLTVVDNIFVLRHGFRKYVINQHTLESQLKPFMEDIGVDIPADAYIEELSVYERFVVEILKAVVSGAWVIAIEDPGMLVSSDELQALHRILRHYSAEGFSIIYISEHSERTVDLCDRIAYMEGGQMIKTFIAGERLPAGKSFIHDDNDHECLSAADTKGSAALELIGFSCGRIHDAYFRINEGECVAIADADPELTNKFISMITAPEGCSGKVLSGRTNEAEFNKRDIAVIPMNASEKLLFPEMSYTDNLMFNMDHRVKNVWRDRDIGCSLRKELSGILGEDVFDMSPASLSDIQKTDLIYMRILLQKPVLVCCVQPFWAAGISKRMHIAYLIERFKSKGIAVLLFTSGINEALMAASRIYSVNETGKIVLKL